MRSVMCLERGEKQPLHEPNKFYQIEFASKTMDITYGKGDMYFEYTGAIHVPPYDYHWGYHRCFLVILTCESATEIYKVEDSVRAFVHTRKGHEKSSPVYNPNPYNSQAVAYDGPNYYGALKPHPQINKYGAQPASKLNLSCILTVPQEGDDIRAECVGLQSKGSTKDYLVKHVQNCRLFVYELNPLKVN